MYASETFERDGMSSGGDFSQGFGICPEEHKPAVLWFYNHVIEPGPEKTYDATVYPHRAVYAFVNWPVGMQERNPGEVLPHGLVSRRSHYHVFRDRWQDADDLIVVLSQNAGFSMGQGKRLGCGGGFPSSFVTTYAHEDQDGATVITAGPAKPDPNQTCKSIAVDFSRLSGAVALIAEVALTGEPTGSGGPGTEGMSAEEQEARRKLIESGRRGRRDSVAPSRRPAQLPPGPWWCPTAVYLGGREYTVRTYQEGTEPEVSLIGEGKAARILVGRRTIASDDRKIILGKAE